MKNEFNVLFMVLKSFGIMNFFTPLKIL